MCGCLCVCARTWYLHVDIWFIYAPTSFLASLPACKTQCNLLVCLCLNTGLHTHAHRDQTSISAVLGAHARWHLAYRNDWHAFIQSLSPSLHLSIPPSLRQSSWCCYCSVFYSRSRMFVRISVRALCSAMNNVITVCLCVYIYICVCALLCLKLSAIC